MLLYEDVLVYNKCMKNIEIKNLNKKFGEQWVISNFSFTFEAGKKYAVIGANGSGKTTLLNLIAGLESYDSGSIKIGDKERNKLSTEGANISYILESPLFFEHKSVLKNLEYVNKVEGKNLSQEELVRIIEKFNLNPNDKVKKLTYIEKLLLSFARIEVKKSDILLIDLNEIVSKMNLESDVFKDVFLWLKNFSGTVVVVENGANFASKFTDDILFLNFGVNKGKIDLKKEMENPSNFFLYKSACEACKQENVVKEIVVQKLMVGYSIVSDTLTKEESSNLKNLLLRRADLKIEEEMEIVKYGDYFFNKIGGAKIG